MKADEQPIGQSRKSDTMAPRGIAILLGAGPNVGAGIARVLASPSQGNLAVALLSRNPDNLSSLASSLQKSSGGGVFHTFPSDTSPENLRSAFAKIKEHESFKGLKLEVAVFNPKISHKVPFLEETSDQFGKSLQDYVTGAMVFGQESAKWMLEQYPETREGEPLQKKGTIIFTGTLGALRANTGFGAYGAGRSGVRMLAQSMAREFSGKGVHVVHTVINGAVTDTGNKEDEQKFAEGRKCKADSVGKTYLWLAQQDVDLFTHELDLRPAAEKF